METEHIKYRKSRVNFIEDNIGIGSILDTFLVDKGHVNGKEYHSITNTGIIIIKNARTEKLITMLIARPQQVRRYYLKENKQTPKEVILLAEKHTELGYNNL